MIYSGPAGCPTYRPDISKASDGLGMAKGWLAMIVALIFLVCIVMSGITVARNRKDDVEAAGRKVDSDEAEVRYRDDSLP